jgi:hypothetical protein
VTFSVGSKNDVLYHRLLDEERPPSFPGWNNGQPIDWTAEVKLFQERLLQRRNVEVVPNAITDEELNNFGFA